MFNLSYLQIIGGLAFINVLFWFNIWCVIRVFKTFGLVATQPLVNGFTSNILSNQEKSINSLETSNTSKPTNKCLEGEFEEDFGDLGNIENYEEYLNSLSNGEGKKFLERVEKLKEEINTHKKPEKPKEEVVGGVTLTEYDEDEYYNIDIYDDGVEIITPQEEALMEQRLNKTVG